MSRGNQGEKIGKKRRNVLQNEIKKMEGGGKRGEGRKNRRDDTRRAKGESRQKQGRGGKKKNGSRSENGTIDLA